MSFLLFVWQLSLVLAGAALAIMLVLIGARIASDRRARRREAQRRVLVPALLGASDLAPETAGKIAPDVVAEVATSLIQMVRGDDRQAFIERAVKLGVPERLARLLRSGSDRTRLAAAQAMGAFDDPKTLHLLRRALNDRNHDVRLAAALSIAAAGDTESAADIVPRLGQEEEEPSLLLVSLFKRIAADRPEDIKQLVTDPHSHSRVKVAAIEALASTGDYTLVPLIADLALAAPDNSEELPRYLRALSQLAHPAGRRAVIAGLERPGMAARAAAAGAAGKIGLTETAPTLRKLLDDPEWWVRFRAAEALIGFGESGRELLRDAIRSGSPRARDAAATMLAEHGIAS